LFLDMSDLDGSLFKKNKVATPFSREPHGAATAWCPSPGIPCGPPCVNHRRLVAVGKKPGWPCHAGRAAAEKRTLGVRVHGSRCIVRVLECSSSSASSSLTSTSMRYSPLRRIHSSTKEAYRRTSGAGVLPTLNGCRLCANKPVATLPASSEQITTSEELYNYMELWSNL
jgi:hypothetical protein